MLSQNKERIVHPSLTIVCHLSREARAQGEDKATTVQAFKSAEANPGQDASQLDAGKPHK